jgi:tRNA-dependent cyclodipeptide synthase
MKDPTARACEQAGTARVVQSNLFIPISLGNHYYSRKILREVFVNFIAHSNVSIIFLCDRLRFLTYRMRGVTNLETINSKIRIQIDQMNRTLANLGLGSYPNVSIVSWSFLKEDHRYDRLLQSLQEFIHADAEVRLSLNDFAATLIARFYGLGSANLAQPTELQRQYIIEETALSLFMTEIKGYNVEVYRRGMGFVDYLYRERPSHLKLLTEKATLNRRFIALEGWLKQTSTKREP